MKNIKLDYNIMNFIITKKMVYMLNIEETSVNLEIYTHTQKGVIYSKFF